MDLLPTMTLYWTANGQLALARPSNGLVNLTTLTGIYSDPISTDGADQIGLLVYTTPSGVTGGTDGNVYVRIAWAGVVPDSDEPTGFVEECVEVLGAAGTGYQRFSLSVKEFGPFTTSPATRGTIWTPAAAHFFKVGCYADAAVTNNAAITVIVERARTGAPLGTARTF